LPYNSNAQRSDLNQHQKSKADPGSEHDSLSGGEQNVALGFNLFCNRAGGGVVRIYRDRVSGRGHRKIPLFSFPGYLPGLFHSRHFGCEKTAAVFVAKRMAARWQMGSPIRPAVIPGALRPETVAAARGTRAKVDGAIRFAPVSHAVRR
jgi:hypothetical protein